MQEAARGAGFRADDEFVLGVQDDIVNSLEDFFVEGAAETGDEYANGAGFGFFEVAGKGVGVIVEFLSRLQDALAGGFADVAGIVQHVGCGGDADAGSFGYVADGGHEGPGVKFQVSSAKCQVPSVGRPGIRGWRQCQCAPVRCAGVHFSS